MARINRDLESRDNQMKYTRESELREHEMLISYNMNYANPLDIPIGVQKEGFSYYWASTYIRGEASTGPDSVDTLLNIDWTLVPRDRAPNYSHDPLNRNPYCAQYIARKDLILMERPEIYSKRATDALNQHNYNKIKSLNGVRDNIGGNYYGNSQGSSYGSFNRISTF